MKRLFLPAAISVLLASCAQNAITGRNQLSLVSGDELKTAATAQYAQFLKEHPPVTSGADAAMVKRVGSRIATAIQKYYAGKGQSNALAGYQWQFNLVNGNEVNAWCMPGGKVVVYTGLLPVTKNETALAIVLGHEITHAIADHGKERMSQVMLAQGLGTIGDAFTQNKAQANSVFNNVYGPAASVGVLLPNSRKQELEADHYGLIFAALAGYDPREAVPFWERMAAGSKSKPPAFLSTHPADEDRIARIKEYLPEALKYYKK